jgi:hypothetical protein
VSDTHATHSTRLLFLINSVAQQPQQPPSRFQLQQLRPYCPPRCPDPLVPARSGRVITNRALSQTSIGYCQCGGMAEEWVKSYHHLSPPQIWPPLSLLASTPRFPVKTHPSIVLWVSMPYRAGLGVPPRPSTSRHTQPRPRDTMAYRY